MAEDDTVDEIQVKNPPQSALISSTSKSQTPEDDVK